MKFIKAGLIVASALWLTACGSNEVSNIVRNIDVRTYEHPQTRHTYVEVKAKFDATNMVFPSAFLTVVDPENPGRELGTVQLQNDMNGQNLLTLNADVSGFKLGDYISDSKLPNGNPLPVTGLSKVLALNVKEGKTRIYIAEQNDQLVVGIAVAMKEFDGLAASIPNSNIFFGFNGGPSVTGVAGFFTGSKTSESGLAMFAKTSFTNPLGAARLAKASSVERGPQFVVRKPRQGDLMKAQYFFWNLNRRGGQLTLAK